MRVLLVEPDAVLGGVYKKALTLDGHSVVLAGHAQQAVLAMDEGRPDIVVLELQLRQHSGIEFLYEIRSYPEWGGIPVLVHSVVPPRRFDGPAIFEQLHVVDYLYKPQTSLRQLRSAVSAARQSSVV